MPPSRAGQKCWNCKRRRLKCDGRRPKCDKCSKNGADCLGYGKVFQWISGMASRGTLTPENFGRSLAVADDAGTSTDRNVARVSPVSNFSSDGDGVSVFAESEARTPSTSDEDIISSQESSPRCESQQLVLYLTLVDTALQDMTYDERFFVNHCECHSSDRSE